MNEVLFNKLITEYNHLAFTHHYIFGYADKGNVYVSFAEDDVLPYVCTLDKVASNRVGGYALRFKPNKAQKEILKLHNSFVLCSVDYFEELVKNTIYNRGEVFEKLVTEYFGQEWVKDNVPFTVAGDIEYNGIAYQIKYEKATFVNEAQLARFMKA